MCMRATKDNCVLLVPETSNKMSDDVLFLLLDRKKIINKTKKCTLCAQILP